MVYSANALRRMITFLETHQVPYMVVGGLALATWGETRVTRDADFKVSIDISLAEFRKMVFEHFQERISSIPKHMLSPYVIQIWVEPDMAADILVSIFDYEREAIQRAIKIEIFGVPTSVCTAEDLIIHKAVANRPRDWLDIEGILIRQRGKLNIAFIRNWLTQFAEALEKPELLTRFNQLYENV